jgi:hypothetical protein
MLISDRLFDGRDVATSPGGYPSRQCDRLPEVTDSLAYHDLRFVILEIAAGDRAGIRVEPGPRLRRPLLGRARRAMH